MLQEHKHLHIVFFINYAIQQHINARVSVIFWHRSILLRDDKFCPLPTFII